MSGGGAELAPGFTPLPASVTPAPAGTAARGAAGLADALLFAIVFIGGYNALARHVGGWLQVPLTGNTLLELQWYGFGFASLLAGAWTFARGKHVRVDVLYDRLPVRGQRWVDRIGHAGMLIPFALFVVWVSWPRVADAWARGERGSDPGSLPLFPARLVIPVAFVLLGYEAAVAVIRTFARPAVEAKGTQS